jgi:hypothetical protein
MSTLAPQLEKRSVDPNKLFLDPNNPRLFTKEEEKVPLENVTDPGVQDRTTEKIFNDKDTFSINELIQAILIRGYVPEAGGYMFVRALSAKGQYIVLEGNRRLTAIRKILAKQEEYQAEYPDAIRSLKKIDVLEIVDEISEEDLQVKISYLLGTSHHGSKKHWSPFAEAKEVFTTYLSIAGQDEADFQFNSEHAATTASQLNTDTKQVKERLAVYRAMKQLSATEEMKSTYKGGIIDAYYSIVKEAVCSGSQQIKEYIKSHPDTFILEDEAIERMINLCKFNGKKNREGSPMNNPKQWGFLSKILEDDDEEKRTENLSKVEENHESPNEVWAVRAEELRRMDWKTWLKQVYLILKDVPMGDLANLESDGAHEALKKVDSIISQLANTEEPQNGNA